MELEEWNWLQKDTRGAKGDVGMLTEGSIVRKGRENEESGAEN